jgi:hypothetical protein
MRNFDLGKERNFSRNSVIGLKVKDLAIWGDAY